MKVGKRRHDPNIFVLSVLRILTLLASVATLMRSMLLKPRMGYGPSCSLLVHYLHVHLSYNVLTLGKDANGFSLLAVKFVNFIFMVYYAGLFLLLLRDYFFALPFENLNIKVMVFGKLICWIGKYMIWFRAK